MDYFESFIQSTKQLIRINSVEDAPLENMPFGKGVNDALLLALDIAKKLGFTTFNGDGYYGYAEIGKGSEMLGILGHLDTVPIGADWTVPALSGDIIDGVLYGRGILDDKGPIIATLYAVKQIIDSGLVPNKRIRLIFGTDEESGWQCIDKYVEKEEIPTIAFTPDGDFPVINCEKGVAYFDVTCKKPSYIKCINGGDRANMVMDYVKAEIADDEILRNLSIDDKCVTVNGNSIIATGISAHGSTPTNGDNAFWKLLKTLAPHDDWAAKMDKIITNTDGSGYNIDCCDEVSGHLTINVGTVKSEGEFIKFSLDVRHPLCITRDNLHVKLCSAFAGFEVEKGFFHNPLYIAPDHPLCKSLLDAYAEVTGDKLNPITIGGGTYARALPVAVAFGPIFPNQESTIHQRNERCKVSDLRRMYDIYLVAIRKLAFE